MSILAARDREGLVKILPHLRRAARNLSVYLEVYEALKNDTKSVFRRILFHESNFCYLLTRHFAI